MSLFARLKDLALLPFQLIRDLPWIFKAAAESARAKERYRARVAARNKAGRPGVVATAATQELDRQFSSALEFGESGPIAAVNALERFANQQSTTDGPAYYSIGAVYLPMLLRKSTTTLDERETALRSFIVRFGENTDPGAAFWLVPAAYELAMTLFEQARASFDHTKVDDAVGYIEMFLTRYRAFDPLYREELLMHVTGLTQAQPTFAELLATFREGEIELLNVPQEYDLSEVEALNEKHFREGLAAAMRSDVQARAILRAQDSTSSTFALILRGFGPEAEKVAVPSGYVKSFDLDWTRFENQFSEYLTTAMPTITISNPLKDIAAPGGISHTNTPRLLLGDDWLNEVRLLIQRSRLIVMFTAGFTPGVMLELREIVECGRADATVLVTSADTEAIERPPYNEPATSASQDSERAALLARFHRRVSQAAIAAATNPLDLPAFVGLLHDEH